VLLYVEEEVAEEVLEVLLVCDVSDDEEVAELYDLDVEDDEPPVVEASSSVLLLLPLLRLEELPEVDGFAFFVVAVCDVSDEADDSGADQTRRFAEECLLAVCLNCCFVFFTLPLDSDGTSGGGGGGGDGGGGVGGGGGGGGGGRRRVAAEEEEGMSSLKYVLEGGS
jgi:uncharacterized membrane protein YgcG